MKQITTNQTTKQKRKRPKGGDGFFESLKEIGHSTIASVKDEVVKGVGQGIHDQLVYSTPRHPSQENPEFDFAQWLDLQSSDTDQAEKQQEAFNQGRRYERHLNHLDGRQETVFSSAETDLQRQIEEVRQELRLLIQTIGKVEQQVETAVVQEVVDPGIYHLNFFHKLASWLRLVRKSLQEGELWLEMWHSRSKRSAYWNGVKKAGTSFMLSGERAVVTQTG